MTTHRPELDLRRTAFFRDVYYRTDHLSPSWPPRVAIAEERDQKQIVECWLDLALADVTAFECGRARLRDVSLTGIPMPRCSD